MLNILNFSDFTVTVQIVTVATKEHMVWVNIKEMNVNHY